MGAHLGQDKTEDKIVARFHWKDMVNEICEFVKTCDICQRNNDVKFIKADVALHPIPVKSKVWYWSGI